AGRHPGRLRERSVRLRTDRCGNRPAAAARRFVRRVGRGARRAPTGVDVGGGDASPRRPGGGPGPEGAPGERDDARLGHPVVDADPAGRARPPRLRALPATAPGTAGRWHLRTRTADTHGSETDCSHAFRSRLVTVLRRLLSCAAVGGLLAVW